MHAFIKLFSVVFFMCIAQNTHFILASNDKKVVTPIYLPVIFIEIIDDYISHGEEPYVDHKVSPSPLKTTHEWLNNLCKPSGASGSAIIRIQEVSLRWQKRPGRLEKQGYWPYRGIIRLRIEIYNKKGKLKHAFTPEVTKVREINENFFGGNKYEMWDLMLEEMRQGLDFEIRHSLKMILQMKKQKQKLKKARTLLKANRSQEEQSIKEKSMKPVESSTKIKDQTPSRKSSRKKTRKGTSINNKMHTDAPVRAASKDSKAEKPSLNNDETSKKSRNKPKYHKKRKVKKSNLSTQSPT